jgi:hypothetical protein
LRGAFTYGAPLIDDPFEIQGRLHFDR